MQQFFSNSLHEHSWYKFNMFSFINWFIIALIAIFTMSDEWIFSLSITFLNQTIFKIFKFSWSFALSFISLLMITFWLFVFIMMCISCARTAKIQCIICIKFMISFAHVWNLFRFAWASELTAWSVMSSLSSLQRNMIRFLWTVDMFVISWRICSIDFFCIFSIFFLSAIFIMTSHFLHRLIVESNFHIYILTRFDYSDRTFRLDSITRIKHSDSAWYWPRVRIRFEFSTRLAKQSKMTSKELNIEIFPVFRLCITFLHYLFGRKSWRETWRRTWRETWRSFDRELW